MALYANRFLIEKGFDIEAELMKFEPGSKDRLLLEKVLDKLGPNFARKSVQEEARKARQQKDEAMHKYFEKLIIYDASTEAAAEQEHQMSLSREVHPFNMNETRKFLPNGDDSTISRFCGLTQKDIPNASELQMSSFQLLVSEKLKEFFVKIIECTGGSLDEGDWRKSFDLALKEINSKIDNYANAKKDASSSKKQLKYTIDVYQKELERSLTLLIRLLELYQEKLDSEAISSQRLMYHSAALAKKIEIFHMKLNLATYNLKTLPALNHISSELNHKQDTLEKEKKELNDIFEKYSQLGKEYESLVDEIMDLTKRIEEEQLSIDELKRLMVEADVS